MRISTFAGWAVAAIVGAGAFDAAPASDFGPGEKAYQIHCATCHGADAQGDGPLAQHLQFGAPALTGIAAANDGVFPALDIMMVIDGRTGVRGHGGDMPVWGTWFEADMEEDFGHHGTEAQVRARILELVFYLQSIQEYPHSTP